MNREVVQKWLGSLIAIREQNEGADLCRSKLDCVGVRCQDCPLDGSNALSLEKAIATINNSPVNQDE